MPSPRAPHPLCNARRAFLTIEGMLFHAAPNPFRSAHLRAPRLHALTLSIAKSFRIRSYENHARNSFRIRSYENTGGEGFSPKPDRFDPLANPRPLLFSGACP